MGVFFVGIIGFTAWLIVLICKAALKKPKKIAVIHIASFLLLSFVGMIIAMNTPAVDSVMEEYKATSAQVIILQEKYDALKKDYDKAIAELNAIGDKKTEETVDAKDEEQPKKETTSSDAKPESKAEASSVAPKPSSDVTMGQKNALAKAKSYLDYTAFSYQGLVKQLEYEKFSNEDAIYGANNCGANWNEQAEKKAKSYLEYTSFSRDSLIEQLVYEGFTKEQAAYGADKNGF